MSAHRGFTLIELIASIVVIGVIAAAGAPVLYNSIQAYNATLNTLQTLDKLRYTAERLARELREVSYSSSTSTFQFTNGLVTTPTSSSSTSLKFSKTDYLVSGSTVTSTPLTVDVTTSGSNLSVAYTNGTTRTSAVLTDQLSSLSFAYYNSTGTTATSTANVRYVEILLTLTSNNGQSYSTKTRVALRNI